MFDPLNRILCLLYKGFLENVCVQIALFTFEIRDILCFFEIDLIIKSWRIRMNSSKHQFSNPINNSNTSLFVFESCSENSYQCNKLTWT